MKRDPLAAFSEKLKKARGKRRLRTLAEQSRVSTRTICLLENPEQLRGELEQSGGEQDQGLRKKRALARAVVRLGKSLVGDPDTFLSDWMKVVGLTLSTAERGTLIEAATGAQGLSPAPPPAAALEDTWVYVQRKKVDEEPIRVTVGVLSYLNQQAKGWRAFYVELIELVLARVSKTLLGDADELIVHPVFLDEFATLFEQLNNPEERFRLRVAIGVSESLSRRVRFGINFLPIPGMNFRLNCLTRREAPEGLTWDTVLRAPQSRGETWQVRAVTIAGEIGDEFLIGECGFREGKHLHRHRPGIQLIKLAKDFAELLEKDAADGTCSVLICGQEHGAPVAALLAAKGYDLQDLSVRADADVPCHREALAVHQADVEWYKQLKESMTALFADETCADRLAACYASYLVAMLDESTAAVQAALEEENPSLPSHIRLQLFGLPVSAGFRDQLEARLRDELRAGSRRTHLRPRDVEKLIEQILPWKRQAIEALEKLRDELGTIPFLERVRDVVGEEALQDPG